MDKSDREEAVRILGFGSGSKILSDPYPLGGYAGFELGLALESLPVEDLAPLGDRLSQADRQQDITYPKISIGKGVYNNLDFFFNFVPYDRMTGISQYGSILRWGFFQATFLPLSLSLMGHANSTNFDNKIITRTMGLDLMGGINVNDVALFAGFGPVYSTGRFVGGDAAITESGVIENATVSGFHTVVGANVHVSQFFVAVQIDRYRSSVLSGKLGFRF